jgi:hypothetical protein
LYQWLFASAGMVCFEGLFFYALFQSFNDPYRRRRKK